MLNNPLQPNTGDIIANTAITVGQIAKKANTGNIIANTASAVSEAAKKPNEQRPEEKNELKSPILTASKAKHNPSPIKSQKKDIRSQPDYLPLSITFLDGAYKGQTIEIGLAVNELSHSQEAEWEDIKGQALRKGANYKGISTRSVSFSLMFFDWQHDISHLAENIAHLQEITDDKVTPPTLLIKHGDVKMSPVVCISFDLKYENPLPDNRGFRQCTVELKFKLLGGNASANSLAPPLTGTPLADWKNTKTKLDRQKEAAKKVALELLAPCLKEQGSQEVADLLDRQKLNDVQEVLKLSPDAFFQTAVAGMYSKKMLENPVLRDKLRKDTAAVLAAREDGIGINDRKLAQALLDKKPTNLPVQLQQQFDQILGDYELIVKTIISQDIGGDSNSDLFDRTAQPSANNRFYNMAGCGLSLREAGAPQAGEPTENDQKTLDEINKILSDKNAKPEDIKKMFGLKSESQIRTLKNGVPYTSKTQFIQDSSRQSIGLTGYSIWGNFVKYQNDKKKPETPEKPAK